MIGNFPAGGRLSHFSASLAVDYLSQVCPGVRGQAAIFLSLWEDPCIETAARAPTQVRGSVGERCVPPEEWDHGEGSQLLQGTGHCLLSGHQVRCPSSTYSQLISPCFEVLCEDPADTSVPLVVPSVWSQEFGGGEGGLDRCLSMEGPSFWPSHTSQGVYQTPRSCSSRCAPTASAAALSW